jgi:hypothetical protein
MELENQIIQQQKEENEEIKELKRDLDCTDKT